MKINSNCITNDAGHCPMCNSNNLNYEESFIKNEYIYYPYTCSDCGTTGREEYYLDYCKHVNIYTKDGEYLDNAMYDTEYDKINGEQYDR